MPTVIDELIVSLGLDPTAFTRGQQKATETLRKLEESADRSGKKIGEGSAKNLRTFLEGIDDPIKAGIKSLTDLGAQAEQSGNAIAKGAGVGATGLAALATAGLGALAVVKSLQGVFNSVISTMSSSAAAGRLANWISGEPGTAQALSKEAIAAHISSHANPEQTMQSIFTLQQDVQQLLTKGVFSENLRKLSYLGVTNYQAYANDPQKMIEDIIKGLQRYNLPQAQAMLQGVLPREFIQHLKLDPQSREAARTRANEIALTDQQIQAFISEQQALDYLQDSWESFIRKLESAAAPAITHIINEFSRWLVELQKDPAAIKEVETGISLLAAVFGVTLVAGITKAIIALNSFWALPIIKFLASGAGLGFLAGLFTFLYPKTANAGEQEEMRKHPELYPNVLPPGGYQEQERDQEFRWWNPFTWFNGKAEPGPADPQSQMFTPGITDPRTSAAANFVAFKESKNQNVMNWRYKENPLFYTAGGYYQITRSNWRNYGPRVGIDTSRYPDAIDAPRDLQDRVFAAMFRDQGFAPWRISAGGSITPQDELSFNRMGQTNFASQTPLPTAIEQARSSNIQYGSGLGMIRNYNAGDTNTTNSDNRQNTEVNVGNINVTGGGSNPYKTGDAVASAIRRQILVSATNTGIE